jgi:nicotinamide phosphoribosyltransferase
MRTASIPNMQSILLNVDSYKVSMWKQNPPGVKKVYSYVESRGGRYPRTVFFGLQSFIKEYLLTPFTQADLDFADKFWTAHGEPFNYDGWKYILDVHGGYLPLAISAPEEGTVIPYKNVLATVVNTDDNVPWLTTWVETAMLRAIWYGTTVASQSWTIKQIIVEYLEKSGTPESIGYKCHDFGARGVSSFESAGLGACAHLVNFSGTDTVTGLLYAHAYYGADLATTAHSIPASEHSVITVWGREQERDAYANIIKQFNKPGALFACVSDSYDIYAACKMWGSLKPELEAGGGTLVIRPDSGDPLVVLPKMLAILEQEFGVTKNSKGYKILNTVRLLWGDGIDELSIRSILRTVVDLHGFSADNIAFGMGGKLLQIVDRDTNKFAMKASAALIGDTWIDVFKDPVTDQGKSSKKGRVDLYKDIKGEYYTSISDPTLDSELQLVFRDGTLFRDMQFEQVRTNSNQI